MKNLNVDTTKTTIRTFFPNTAMLLLLLITIVISSCDKDDPIEPPVQELLPLEIMCSPQLADGETLTLEDRNNGIDYIINCVYTVGGDLIVNPGVTIQFGSDAGINVSRTGSIQLLGTADENVILTGEDKIKGSWKGVFIISDNAKNKIEYTKIDYAGGGSFNSNGDQGGVIIYSESRLYMNNTTITNSETYGINAVYGKGELRLEDNTITNCEIPVLVLPNYVDAMAGGSYTGNETDAIQVANGFVTIDATYRDHGVPYHVLARLVVSAGGGKLTIDPGVEMAFGLNGSLEIAEGASGSKPSLVAVGTAQKKILFTGMDRVLGAWKGIWFDTPSALNEIGFATIEYASNASQDGAIYMWYGTVLNVHDVLFKDIADCAIHQYISTGAPNTLTTSNLTFENVTNTTICQN